jgi:uncharacterized protein YdiU (UPF0061 family)
MYQLIKFTFIWFYIAHSYGQDLSSLVNDNPKKLTDDSYANLKLRALTKATSLYVNKELLEEAGIDTKNSTQRSLYTQAAKTFGWLSESVSFPGASTSNKRDAVTDYYGGRGMGMHKGSARAAIMGRVQIKGVGTTPVFFKEHSDVHDGRAGFHDALKEVVWGNMLANELPYGANRVFALIDTHLQRKSGEKHILIVRENPVRAGHFVNRSFGSDDEDQLRVDKNLHSIDKHLIHRNKDRAELVNFYSSKKINEDVYKRLLVADEWLYRLSKQVSRAYAFRYFHGATSESNINLNGEFIDYGTSTTNSGYGRISFLDHKDTFGEFKEVSKLWGPGLVNRLFSDLDGVDHKLLEDAALLAWDKYFKQARAADFLLLIGVPKDVLPHLRASTTAQELGEKLFQLAQRSGKQGDSVNVKHQIMPDNSGSINIQKLFRILSGSSQSKKELYDFIEKDKLIKVIEANELHDLLKKTTGKVHKALEKSFGLKLEASQRLMQENAKWLNRNQKDLYHNNLKDFTSKIASKYSMTDNFNEIQLELDNLLIRNLKSIKGLPPYSAPLGISVINNKNILKLYNAQKDQEYEVEIEIKKGKLKVLRSSSGVDNCRSLLKLLVS